MPIDLPGTFFNDVNVPLSAADLNLLREQAVYLDGLCAGRRMAVTPSSGAQTTGAAADWHPRGDYRQSWWALYYRTGMTTLTVEGKNDYRLDFYLNGVFNSFQAATPAGFTKNITLSGYADGDVILLDIRTNGNPATAPAGYSPKYVIMDVYGSPITVASAWPGVPTFAGTYDAARLNQLSDACAYIWDRVRAVPIPPQAGMVFIPASHKAETIRLYNGAVGRYATNEVLRVAGILYCRTNAEHYVIDYNGSTVATSATFSEGTTTIVTHPIPLTHTIGTRAEVAIRAVIENNVYDDQPGVFSSYVFTAIRSEADGSGYATTAPPTAFTAEESITSATLNSRLNSIATMLSAAKAKLDARPELWNRARAARRVFATDDTQANRNMRRHAALFQRQGDTLITRGKAVKVGYGAINFAPPKEENEPIHYNAFTFANEISIGTTEDKSETTTVLLDNLPGLEPGMLYYVWSGATGALEGAWEWVS